MTSYTGSRHTPNPCRSSCSESLKVLQLPSTLFIRRHLNGGGSDIEAGTKPWEKKLHILKMHSLFIFAELIKISTSYQVSVIISILQMKKLSPREAKDQPVASQLVGNGARIRGQISCLLALCSSYCTTLLQAMGSHLLGMICHPALCSERNPWPPAQPLSLRSREHGSWDLWEHNLLHSCSKNQEQ